MRSPIRIENIEDLRRCQGIDDVDLHDAVRGLRVGDVVHLTLIADGSPAAAETVAVRITRRRAAAFLGRLAQRPRSAAFAAVPAEATLRFTVDHIHSLPARPLNAGGGVRREPRPRHARKDAAADRRPK